MRLVKTLRGRLILLSGYLIGLALVAASDPPSALLQTQTIHDRLERAAGLIRDGQLSLAEAELNTILRGSLAEANASNLLGVIRAQLQRSAEAERFSFRLSIRHQTCWEPTQI